ncbi:MAG: branched-chain amino acid ABC transporter permease [Acidobacteria bacterium]|nr:branched-chain amino acid ABC transporter permease [Acidobacteriota bacterium]
MTPRVAPLLALAAVVLVLPRLVFDSADFALLSLAVVYAIVGLSLNVLIGYAGTISLGHQAFVGIGAFTSAYVVTELRQPFIVGVLAAAALGGAQAMILGGLALRVTGLYFALVTLSYGVFAQDTLFGIKAITGGGAGRAAPTPTGDGNFVPYYYICLAFLGLVLWLDWRMMRSKTGRALTALRQDPRVAASLGIPVKAYLLLGFAVSGVFAGIAGALFAHGNGFVVSNDFSLQLGILFVLMTVVGGLRSRTGIVVSAALTAVVPLIIREIPGLESALARPERTVPVVVLVAGLVAVGVGVLRGGRAAQVVGVAMVALSAAVLSPLHVPGVEPQLEQLPALDPSMLRLIVLPALVVMTLRTAPGGLGQQLRPVVRWVCGGRFSLDAGPGDLREVVDARA